MYEGVEPYSLGPDALQHRCAVGPVIDFIYPVSDIFEDLTSKFDGCYGCDEFESRYGRAVLRNDSRETPYESDMDVVVGVSEEEI